MSKFKYIPNFRIMEILSSPNGTGIDGKDYDESELDEMRQVLYSRQNVQDTVRERQVLVHNETYRKMIKVLIKDMRAFEPNLEEDNEELYNLLTLHCVDYDIR